MKTKLLTICLLLFTSQVFAEVTLERINDAIKKCEEKEKNRGDCKKLKKLRKKYIKNETSRIESRLKAFERVNERDLKCSKISGKAKTDYAAEKIYSSCMRND